MEYKDILDVNSVMDRKPIKGKGYAEVADRVQAFRKIFPEGKITTEIVSFADGLCIVKATAAKPDGEILATGHAYERENSSNINKTSFLENCETSAVGRCLSFIGLGSEKSIASYEEVEQAIAQQEAPRPVSQQEEETMPQIIRRLAKEKKIAESDICRQGDVEKIEDMHPSQMDACITWLRGMK